MSFVDSYDASLTSVEYPWPKRVTPLERIVLSTRGNLQRILSAFFARPITITSVFAQTTPRPTQKRQVHLVCAGRSVCVATSAVTITNARCAKLFLQEGYAIGQIFRKMGVVPAFELLDVGLVGDSEKSNKLWRRYTLKIEGFAADIVEVFPDREMFTRAEEWLAEPQLLSVPIEDASASCTPGLSPTETLVHPDEIPDVLVAPPTPAECVKETWADSSNGMLRFMAVFIAVMLLLNVPRDGETMPQAAGSLFARIARLLDITVHGAGEET
ncbi:hypothetical protein DFH11DRAFT_1616701 [Phellopilus nigrolimitatus]|nr:hypothetical protein DFH11DRAFT_1616701 [Phellopilus nigrolimitatus]